MENEKETFVKIITKQEERKIAPGKVAVDINYTVQAENMSLADMAAAAIYLLENVSRQAQKHGHSVSSMISSAFCIFEKLGADIEEKVSEAQNGTK